ncbi:MAG: right-handed parallel beta-helix repeat-containing protein [Paracoccaceae bacterium]
MSHLSVAFVFLAVSSPIWTFLSGTARAEISAMPSGPTISVENPSALERAYLTLSGHADGGGTILLAPNFPPGGEIALKVGGPHPVHITSTDPARPARISRIALSGVDNLRMSHLHIDSTGVARAKNHRDIDIIRSGRLAIVDSTFTSNGSTTFNPSDPNAVLGERLSMIRHVKDMTFARNRVSGYEQGLTLKEADGVTISDNEITAMQGDGIRLVGVQDVLIKNNDMYDFSATPNEFTHSDFIQMWSHRAETISRNITITGNVFDTGNGVAVQPIFMRNIAYERGNKTHIYQNIEITDNLIYTGAANGIAIGRANEVLIASNTLLWNPDAVTVKANGNTSWPPRILIENGVTNARVMGNLATKIAIGSGVFTSGNVLMSWVPADRTYAGRHFVNVARGGDIGPKGWRLRPDSPWVGAGAPASQPNRDPT